MIRGLIVATAVAALLLAVPALADQRYRDATGENPAALDIASVEVTNDATSGDVEFNVLLAHPYKNLYRELGRGTWFDIFIDSDRNRATGNPRGFDAEISTDPNNAGISHWNGKQMNPIDGTSTSGYSNDGFNVGAARTDILLRHPRQSFDFVVVTHRVSSGYDAVDTAPNRGVYTYTLTGVPPPLRVVSTTVAVMSSAAAGDRFQVGQFSVSLTDGTTAPIEDQTCTASIGGKPIPGTGAGHCTWVLPTTSRGKQLVVSVSGHYRGHAYKKRLSYRIA